MQKTRLSLVVILAFWLTGCASLIGPRETEIPLWRLQQAIEKRFPANNAVLSLFDITLSQPFLSLLPDKNRVQISMDTSVAPALLNRTWTGNVAVSGTLALDPAGEAVLLTAPKVEELTLNGQGSAVTQQVRKVGNFFVAQLLQDVPLYRFEPEKLSIAGVRMKPTAIATRADSIVVTFEPVR